MSLSKNTVIYLFSNIFNAAIPFLLMPILTRNLTTGEYGQVAMFQTLVTGLAAFIGLNTVGAANRKYFDDSNERLSHYNGACVQILIFSSLLITVLFVIFSSDISKLLSIPENWVFMAMLFSCFNFLINLRLGQWQIRGQPVKFGILQISNSLSNMAISILLVVFLNYGAQGRVDAQIISSFFLALIAFFFLKKDNLVDVFCYTPGFIKQALSFGVPLIPHIFGAFLLSAVDRIVINDKLGINLAGIYMVSVQISMIFSVIFDAINKAYVPWLFSMLKSKNPNERLTVVKFTYIYITILIFISPIPFLVGPWFVETVAGENYKQAGEIIGLLCLGQIFGGFYLMFANYIFYAKKTGYLALVTLFSGLVNVILLYVFIENYGISGAAMAYVIAKVIQFILTFWLASKVEVMPWLLRQ